LDSVSIDLNGSEVAAIALQGRALRLDFSRAYLIKTMTGSIEQTRWWQAGQLIIEDAEVESPLPFGPLVCLGGDLEENVFTYRDMIPVPFESRGRVGCNLRFVGVEEPLRVSGTAMRLLMQDKPKYIEHLRQARTGQGS
jgi:hypothetical protein